MQNYWNFINLFQNEVFFMLLPTNKFFVRIESITLENSLNHILDRNFFPFKCIVYQVQICWFPKKFCPIFWLILHSVSIRHLKEKIEIILFKTSNSLSHTNYNRGHFLLVGTLVTYLAFSPKSHIFESGYSVILYLDLPTLHLPPHAFFWSNSLTLSNPNS